MSSLKMCFYGVIYLLSWFTADVCSAPHLQPQGFDSSLNQLLQAGSLRDDFDDCFEKSEGLHPDINKPCHHFVVCSEGRAQLRSACPEGFLVDPVQRICTETPLYISTACASTLLQPPVSSRLTFPVNDLTNSYEADTAEHDDYSDLSYGGSVFGGSLNDDSVFSGSVNAGSVLSGSVGKKQHTRRQVFLNHADQDDSAVPLPPDFYWRRDS